MCPDPIAVAVNSMSHMDKFLPLWNTNGPRCWDNQLEKWIVSRLSLPISALQAMTGGQTCHCRVNGCSAAHIWIATKLRWRIFSSRLEQYLTLIQQKLAMRFASQKRTDSCVQINRSSISNQVVFGLHCKKPTFTKRRNRSRICNVSPTLDTVSGMTETPSYTLAATLSAQLLNGVSKVYEGVFYLLQPLEARSGTAERLHARWGSKYLFCWDGILSKRQAECKSFFWLNYGRKSKAQHKRKTDRKRKK